MRDKKTATGKWATASKSISQIEFRFIQDWPRIGSQVIVVIVAENMGREKSVNVVGNVDRRSRTKMPKGTERPIVLIEIARITIPPSGVR